MNWIVITKEDEVSENEIRITGNRYQHILHILKKSVADQIRVIVPGKIKGIYQISKITKEYVEVIPFQIENSFISPWSLSVEIFFALPRPQTGKKILQLCGVYGIGKIQFVFPQKKNKEYLTSPLYLGGELAEIYEGMSQSGNPFVTEVSYIKSTKVFHDLLRPTQAIVFDPSGISYSSFQDDILLNAKKDVDTQFIFGPESGFTNEELNQYTEMKLRIANLGRVILRTEYAFHAFLHQTNVLLETDPS